MFTMTNIEDGSAVRRCQVQCNAPRRNARRNTTKFNRS